MEATNAAHQRDGDYLKVLMVYAGGTIGMTASENGLAPGGNVRERVMEALDTLPAERRSALPEFDWTQVESPIDSSAADPADWSLMANLIATEYHGYRGIVVLHGTDTMTWTTSSLAFQLRGIDRPVIVTGSMLPLGVAESDAVDNLELALRFAAQPRLKGVFLGFGGLLLYGVRARKMSTSAMTSFSSPNAPVVGKYARDGSLRIDLGASEDDRREVEGFELPDYHSVVGSVVRLVLWPGIRACHLATWLNDDRVSGAILEVWGSGNIAQDPALGEVLSRAVESEKLLVAISQCPEGDIQIGHYAAGRMLAEAGVLSGGTMTPEAAFAKVSHLLALPLTYRQRQVRFLEPSVGER